MKRWERAFMWVLVVGLVLLEVALCNSHCVQNRRVLPPDGGPVDPRRWSFPEE